MFIESVELFSGAGGLALGLEKAGWSSQLLIEQDRHACRTLRSNKENGHVLAKHWNVFEGDVREVNYAQIGPTIDLVAGGPPGQPFSLGGKHQGLEDQRDMFPEAVRAVRERQPKYFLFDNVKGLLRSSFQEYFQYILLRLSFPQEESDEGETWEDHRDRLLNFSESKGSKDGRYTYRVNYQLLNASEFGIPQHRYRVIIVGVREDLGWDFEFPQPTHSLDALYFAKYIGGQYWQNLSITKGR